MSNQSVAVTTQRIAVKLGQPCMTMTSNLLSLSEDVLASILFSGYLFKHRWDQLMPIILVNKTFLQLSIKYVTYLRNLYRVGSSKFHKIRPPVSTIWKVAQNLIYFDCSYCDTMRIDDEFTDTILRYKKTLRGLSLRSTKANDACLEVVAQLDQLRFLDLTKQSVEDRYMINDTGARKLSSLKHLAWINLSNTAISDDTLLVLQTNCLDLEHVDISSCIYVKDLGIGHLMKLKLKALDISRCLLVTEHAIHTLATNEKSNALYQTLELLACSFLPLATPNACLSRLLTMPCLRKVEMRQRRPDSILLEEGSEAFLKVVEQAKEKLQESVLYHSDQLRLIEPSIIPIEPGIDKLCPIFNWPYHSNYNHN